MRSFLASLLCLFAFSSLRADPGSMFSVEFSATPKDKPLEVTKVTGTNLLPDVFTLPFQTPDGDYLKITLLLERDKQTKAINDVHIEIIDLRLMSPQGGPTTVFECTCPYKPNQQLPILENNKGTLSFIIKDSPAK